MNIRVTGLLLKDSKLLLLNQDAHDGRTWSLPGGKVEEGETLENALVREMKEETGLIVTPDRLLYVCDFIKEDKHIVHITFLVHEVGGVLGDVSLGLDTNKIREVKFISIDELEAHGFSSLFQSIVKNNFPDSGNYMGPKSVIGL